MTEIVSFTLLDLVIMTFELLLCVIVYAVIRSYFENRKWKKHIYLILEEYRAKYGEDESCELLLYREVNDLKGDVE